MKKKYGCLVLILLFTVNITADAKSWKSLVNKYSSNENVETVKIGKPMLFFAKMFVEDETKDILSKISDVRVLDMDLTNNPSAGEQFFADFRKIVEAKKLEPLVEVREKGEIVNIFLVPVSSRNADLVVLTKDKQSLSFIWISGKISESEIDKLIKQVAMNN